jgi:hypothetical protein
VRFYKQLRRAHNEVRVNDLALCRLTRDSLLPILVALSVDRGGQRGAAADKRSDERCERAQKGWIDLHFSPSW